MIITPLRSYFTYPTSFYEISTQMLIENILEQLQFIKIILNCRAVRLEHFKNYVQVTDDQGNKHTAQAAILAIPWNKVQKLHFEPRIPRSSYHGRHPDLAERAAR